MTGQRNLTGILREAAGNDRSIRFISGDKDESLVSTADLWRRANALLGVLQQRGMQPRDELVIFTKSNESFTVAFWAAVLGGIVPVPVAVGISDEHRLKLVRILRQLDRARLFTEPTLKERLAGFAGERTLPDITRKLDDAILTDALADGGEGELYEPADGDLAFIQYSSGSTSDPKGVCLTHANLASNIRAIIEGTGWNEQDTSLSWMPLTHDMGLIGFHLVMFHNQVEMHLMPTELFVRRPLLWLSIASDVRATILCSPNFGFKHFRVPEGAILHIVSEDGAEVIGPFTHADVLGHGQLWTPVILADSVVLHLSVPPQLEAEVALNLTRVGQGYRGFGTRSKACKSGSCNTDVACLADDDPWNEPRRAVGILTQGGTGFCTGSLVNNTENDHRMLFATAAHCGVNSNSAAAAVRVYWRYESDVCRTPGSAASGSPTPLSAYSSAGETFLAGTNNPFAGGGAANTRSDWSMIELATPPEDNEFDLFWAGWDRRPPPTSCSAPADPSATDGLCASIHHPDGHEKRITFVQVPMTLDNISAAADVHWLANWDPTPPLLANIQPPPASLPPSVTEPGSSGSPLYNADRRLVGVLSGGASFCGVSPGGLNDQYGGLFHSWEGLGTPQTRMRDLLDPTGTGVETIDGLGGCEPPEAPTGVVAGANGDNRIDISWNAVVGIDTYRVLRSDGACPGGGFSQIAEVEAATTYSDLTVSGGNTYSYRIVSVDTEQPCESEQSSCASALAAGACIEPPVFDGLAAATGDEQRVLGGEQHVQGPRGRMRSPEGRGAGAITTDRSADQCEAVGNFQLRKIVWQGGRHGGPGFGTTLEDEAIEDILVRIGEQVLQTGPETRVDHAPAPCGDAAAVICGPVYCAATDLENSGRYAVATCGNSTAVGTSTVCTPSE